MKSNVYHATLRWDYFIPGVNTKAALCGTIYLPYSADNYTADARQARLRLRKLLHVRRLPDGVRVYPVDRD